MGRQLRIDEDIQGFDDEALTALIWMGEHMLRNPDRLRADERTLLQGRVEQFRAEKLRRSKLVRA